MLYTIDDPETFKRVNLVTWRDNTAFWLTGQMRHIIDLHEFMRHSLGRELLERTGNRGAVVDMGCGEAWVLRVLRTLSQSCEYTGLDFNDAIVSALCTRHQTDAKAHFMVHDMESDPPFALKGTADLVVSSFSLFEVPRLDSAITGLASLLNEEGRVLVLSIEPLAQLIAISHDWEDLVANLAQYEAMGSHAAYDKDIDIGVSGSGRTYRGILYSVADYVTAALRSGLRLRTMERVVCTASRVPQVYEAMLFERNVTRDG